MLVTRVVACHMDDSVIGTETRQSIDMGIGVVSCQVAVFQPEKTVCAEK